jgi:hypothetical protein
MIRIRKNMLYAVHCTVYNVVYCTSTILSHVVSVFCRCGSFRQKIESAKPPQLS